MNFKTEKRASYEYDKSRNLDSGKSFILRTFLLFGFLYTFQFKGVNISSRKIVFVILTLWFAAYLFVRLKKKRKLNFVYLDDTIKMVVIVQIFLCVYVMLIGFIFHVPWNMNFFRTGVIFILYSLILPCLFSKMFFSIESLFKSLLSITIFQATIIYMQQFIPFFRLLLSLCLEPFGKFDYTKIDRSVGIGCAGSIGSLLLFFGLIPCAYEMLKSSKLRIRWLITYYYILFAIYTMGRTGFICGILLFLMVLIKYVSRKQNYKLAKIVFVMSIGISLLLIIILSTSFLSTNLMMRINRLSLIRYGRAFWGAFSNMVLPILSSSTLFGSAIRRGISYDGNISLHDSGYIQVIYAYGVILASLFYYVLYRCLYRICMLIKDFNLRYIMFFFILIIMAIEVKESYVYQYVTIFIYFLIYLIEVRKT